MLILVLMHIDAFRVLRADAFSTTEEFYAHLVGISEAHQQPNTRVWIIHEKMLKKKPNLSGMGDGPQLDRLCF